MTCPISPRCCPPPLLLVPQSTLQPTAPALRAGHAPAPRSPSFRRGMSAARCLRAPTRRAQPPAAPFASAPPTGRGSPLPPAWWPSPSTCPAAAACEQQRGALQANPVGQRERRGQAGLRVAQKQAQHQGALHAKPASLTMRACVRSMPNKTQCLRLWRSPLPTPQCRTALGHYWLLLLALLGHRCCRRCRTSRPWPQHVTLSPPRLPAAAQHRLRRLCGHGPDWLRGRPCLQRLDRVQILGVTPGAGPPAQPRCPAQVWAAAALLPAVLALCWSAWEAGTCKLSEAHQGGSLVCRGGVHGVHAAGHASCRWRGEPGMAGNAGSRSALAAAPAPDAALAWMASQLTPRLPGPLRMCLCRPSCMS